LFTFLLTTLGACHQPHATTTTRESDRSSPVTPPANCPYDRRSWFWNMSEADFFCVIDDLGMRAKLGSANALRDLSYWCEIPDAGLSEAPWYEIGAAYEYMGHERFMQTIQPLDKRCKIAVCTWVLGHIDADQATTDRFRSELGVTADEMPFYPDTTPDYDAKSWGN